MVGFKTPLSRFAADDLPFDPPRKTSRFAGVPGRGAKLGSARICIPYKGGSIARSANGAEWWVSFASLVREARLPPN